MSQNLYRSYVGEDHDSERNEEGDHGGVDGERMVEDATEVSLRLSSPARLIVRRRAKNSLQYVLRLQNGLDEERDGERERDGPGRDYKCRHLAAPLRDPPDVQGTGDAAVSVERYGAEMHYGGRRENHVASRPRQTRVETELPSPDDLKHRQIYGMPILLLSKMKASGGVDVVVFCTAVGHLRCSMPASRITAFQCHLARNCKEKIKFKTSLSRHILSHIHSESMRIKR